MASEAVVGCGALGAAGAAQASDASLRTLVRTAAPKIAHSQARILDGLATLDRTHRAAPLFRTIAAQDRELGSLEVRLARQRASTPSGARGKREFLAGLRLIVGSNRTLAMDLRRTLTHQPVSRAQLKAAGRADARGNADLNAGARRLSK